MDVCNDLADKFRKLYTNQQAPAYVVEVEDSDGYKTLSLTRREIALNLGRD